MSSHDLHFKARKEWNDSPILRREFPTFEFYWQENYQRVYSHARRSLFIRNLFRPAH